MSNRRDELIDLTERFTDAFNRQDLDSVLAFFSEDGIYEDSGGGRSQGTEAIRAAFAPLLGGALGEVRFDDERSANKTTITKSAPSRLAASHSSLWRSIDSRRTWRVEGIVASVADG